jgi:hypothetical protein
MNAQRLAAIEKMNEETQIQLMAAWTEWSEAIINAARDPTQASAAAQGETKVRNYINQWRGYVNDMRDAVDQQGDHGGSIDELNRLLEQIEEEKQTLKKLRSEAGTRVDQADSLNPKARPSPYTNILGLQRTFRESTRTTLLWVAIVLGILAIGALIFLIVRIRASGTIMNVSPFTTSTISMTGGGGGVRIF